MMEEKNTLTKRSEEQTVLDSEKVMTKVFKGVLLVNFQGGAMRVLRNVPKKSMRPNEVAINIEVEINIPKRPDTKVAIRVDLSELQVRRIFASDI